jgi:hypothetical protein
MTRRAVSRACGHRNVEGRAWSQAYPRWYAAFKANRNERNHDALVCLDCGTWLPLGPSADDDERVRIEVRAAELVAAGGPDRHCERCGWDMHRHGFYCAPSSGHDEADFHAGWLAREITTHTAQRGEGELKERRAQDLTNEEREALWRARECVMAGCRHDPSHVRRCSRFIMEHGAALNTGFLSMSWVACLNCGTWLPLGESNDAPDEVKVEMAAAAKVTGPGWMVDPHAESLAFAHGWNGHISSYAGEDALWMTDDYAVGYLAHAIADHDHDRITEHGND